MYYTTDKLLEQSQQVSEPVVALVAYRNSESEYYIESHDIDREGRMKEGVPLTRECITELVSSFSLEQSRMPSGQIPANLLYADSRIGHDKYIWYNPPCRRMMYFSRNLNMEDGLYFIPGIVYVAREKSLDLYAFKGKKPVNKLYKAPFFNVTNEKVCLGNASIEYPNDPDYYNLLEYWEKMFWMTEFSHLGGSQNPTKNNLYNATLKWKENFDYNELLPTDVTLQKLIR